MHFVLVTIGSHGDVHPFIGIGQALQSRGHRITLITNGAFQSLANRAGIGEFVALGTEEEFDEVSKNPDLWHARRGAKTILRHISDHLKPVFDTLQKHVTSDSIVIASSLSLAARVDSELRGIRMATVHLSPSIFLSNVDPPVLPGIHLPRWTPVAVRRAIMSLGSRWIVDPMIAPALNAFRAGHGLPPARHIMFRYWHSPHLVIGLFPEWFAKPARDWPPNSITTDFPLYDEADVEPMSEPLERFLADGTPPIVFTPGSAMRFGQAFFDTAVDACALIGRRALLLTRHDDQIPSNLPRHALHAPYAPFSTLLPRCAAIAHHGGIGTTSQGLRAGIPQLVMPLSHDQPDNAHRLERLGVGATVGPRQFRRKRVAGVLKHLLEDSATAKSCRMIAARFPANSLIQTCDVLENFSAAAIAEPAHATLQTL